jgi:hypothetical protein
MWRHLPAALNACKHPAVTWYEARKDELANHPLMDRERIEGLVAIVDGYRRPPNPTKYLRKQ